jgi:hypothetical protein
VDNNGTTRVWLAVVKQALEDVLEPLPAPTIHNHIMRGSRTCKKGCRKICYTIEHVNQLDAWRWFNSVSEAPGSLRWICEHINLSLEATRETLYRRLGAHPVWWTP